MDERATKSAVGANHPESSERTPDYILVIRPRADMGALSEAMQGLKVKKLKRKGWQRCLRPANKLWARIEQAIESLALHYER